MMLTSTLWSQNGYVLTAPDTVPVGKDYKCIIQFDSIKYKNCKIEVLFLNVKVPSTSKFTFDLEYMPVMPVNDYELKVNISGCGESINFSIIKRFYLNYSKVDPAAAGRKLIKDQARILNQGKSTYRSNKYKDFNDYLLSTLKDAKFKSRDLISFTFDIYKDNSLKFDTVTQGQLSESDKMILKKAVEDCKDWTLENVKQDTYRSVMQIDFSKLN